MDATIRLPTGTAIQGHGLHARRHSVRQVSGGADGAVERHRRRSQTEPGAGDVGRGQNNGENVSKARGEMEVNTRLALWLLMIRSRLRALGGSILWERRHTSIGFTVTRPLIDTVLRGWMMGVVGNGNVETMALLRTLVDLLLREARGVDDYRQLFPLLTSRINVHILLLLPETPRPIFPVVRGELVFGPPRRRIAESVRKPPSLYCTLVFTTRPPPAFPRRPGGRSGHAE